MLEYLKIIGLVLLIDGTILIIIIRLFGGCFIGPCHGGPSNVKK